MSEEQKQGELANVIETVTEKVQDFGETVAAEAKGVVDDVKKRVRKVRSSVTGRRKKKAARKTSARAKAKPAARGKKAAARKAPARAARKAVGRGKAKAKAVARKATRKPARKRR